MKFFSLFLLTFILGSSFGWAQEGVASKRTLRLLPVGDSPPFRQEIRDGVRYELPPPEGSVPPSRLQVGVLDEEGKEQKSEYEIEQAKDPGLALGLNRMTARVKIPSQAVVVRLMKKGQVWHQVEVPEGGDYLLVLWRDPKEKNWGKARSRLVPDGGTRFQAGDLRFINVGPVKTGFVIGKQERFELEAGKVMVRSLWISEGTPSEVVYQDPRQGWRRLWSSALVQNRGERSTIVVYFADGEKPRRPLKLIALRERAMALPREKVGE